MDREQSWQAIQRERLALADLLDTLTDGEWDRPSLCDGWRIRDVAAHVALAPQPPSVWTMLVEAVRARGSFHRLNHDVSVRHADGRTGPDLVAELRTHAASRRLPAVTSYRNILYDTLVHAQDIAIPLHRKHSLPLEAARAGAERVWTMGWPFWAKRKFADFRLHATDIEWTAGSGPHDIHGPIEALLMLLTGRTATLHLLEGPGVVTLNARLAAKS